MPNLSRLVPSDLQLPPTSLLRKIQLGPRPIRPALQLPLAPLFQWIPRLIMSVLWLPGTHLLRLLAARLFRLPAAPLFRLLAAQLSRLLAEHLFRRILSVPWMIRLIRVWFLVRGSLLIL